MPIVVRPGAATVRDIEELLSDGVRAFLEELDRLFEDEWRRLVARRPSSEFRADQEAILRAGWRAEPIPEDLTDLGTALAVSADTTVVRVGANMRTDGGLAEFREGGTIHCPAIQGQLNLSRLLAGELRARKDRQWSRDKGLPRPLMVRLRPWHVPEEHILIDRRPLAAALFDFGAYLSRNDAQLAQLARGPYFTLAHVEGFEEARLWNAMFDFSEGTLGLTRNSIKVVLMMDTESGIREMEAMCYALRRHVVGLMLNLNSPHPRQPGFADPDGPGLSEDKTWQRMAQVSKRRGVLALAARPGDGASRFSRPMTEFAAKTMWAHARRLVADRVQI